MLANGMQNRGHQVEVWFPKPQFFSLPVPNFLKKWFGYIDQYLLFPAQFQKKLKTVNKNTLFVFTDQALGPWIPLVVDYAHVIHCHDFIAQQSALGLIPENPVSWTGKQYQSYIRQGYSKGHNFISVSQKTQQDLHHFVNPKMIDSSVVYNGLNYSFSKKDVSDARNEISKVTGLDLKNGYILHIGGNQFYKNRTGVVEIYDAWRSTSKTNLPLLLIGESPNDHLKDRIYKSSYKIDIYTLNNIEDNLISAAYSGASVFLFPSLLEGFGWPIAEAMACGCPVITTNKAPMTEVAGSAGFLISKQPTDIKEIENWALSAAAIVEKVISLSPTERMAVVETGIQNAKRFDTNLALDKIENIYKSILEKHKTK